MLKLLCCTLVLFMCGGVMLPDSLTEYFYNCDQIVIYKNGEEIKADKMLLEPKLQKLTLNAYFSPAFGVSLHEMTMEGLKKGYWIEFQFNDQHVFAGMPFSKLLIEIKPDMYGFNIIRFNDGEYAGRCFYLNLNVSSTEFYKFITSVY